MKNLQIKNLADYELADEKNLQIKNLQIKKLADYDLADEENLRMKSCGLLTCSLVTYRFISYRFVAVPKKVGGSNTLSFSAIFGF